MMINGAIFDMDGVLFDTEKIYQSIWFQLAKERGIELDASFTKLISGTSGEAAANAIKEHYNVSDPKIISDECSRRMLEAVKHNIDVKKGVVKILEFFNKQGIKCVVASGSNKEQIINNLKISNLSKYFDEVVGGDELKRGKPDPDIFLLALKKIGCESSKCLVFEDSFNGIKAAHAANTIPIMVPDLVEPTEEIIKLCKAVYVDMVEALEDIKTMYY